MRLRRTVPGGSPIEHLGCSPSNKLVHTLDLAHASPDKPFGRRVELLIRDIGAAGDVFVFTRALVSPISGDCTQAQTS